MFRMASRSTLVVLLLVLILVACRPDASLPFSTPPQVGTTASDRVKILVSETGIQSVTAEMLRRAGLDVTSLTAANARLSDGGRTVPAVYQDGGLMFYGQDSPSRYYGARPYILELGQPGESIAAEDLPNIPSLILESLPQTVHLEENALYVSEARQEDNEDVWFWSKLAQQSTFSTDVELPDVGDGSGTLRINALGVTQNREVEGDHDFDVLVNDVPIGSVVWDGPVVYTAEIQIPVGVLKSGTNTILLDNRPEGANFLDIMDINWLELDYTAPAVAVDGALAFSGSNALVHLQGFTSDPLVLDVSNPEQPTQIAVSPDAEGIVNIPATRTMEIVAAQPQAMLTPQLAPMRESSWSDPTHQADLLIITTDALAPALAPLVSARESEGLKGAVVPVDEIYDSFGAGAPSPESIQKFIAYAYENWQEPHPRYLLLVGDATYDYRGNLSEPPANQIPSLMVPVQFSGETVSDSRLADVDGDMLPELAVGRWPVQTPAEVESLVARTLAYESEPASVRTLFATDASETTFGKIASDLVTESGLPVENNVQLDGPSPADVVAEWRDGAWLAAYVGHGSIDRWGKDDILDVSTVADLQSTAVPIVLQLTCLTGLFSHPEQTSLAETMLNFEGGPVLVVAASSLTLSTHQEPFAKALLQNLQNGDMPRVGDAFLAAKRGLDIENSNGLREISDTFGLFGDPSAKIVRP